MCQPDVPFLTIADCLKNKPLSEQHSVVVDVVPTLPEQMELDDVLLVPARDESVRTSLPEPLSLVDRAEQFLATYQGHESNSSTAVDSFVRSLKICHEDQMSIENMTKGQFQFNNTKYRQYSRCTITGSTIHQVNFRMRSIQSGKASDANRLVGMCMGTGQSFGGNAATSYGLGNENKAAKSYVIFQWQISGS